jgi:hypothetical protein
VEQIISWAQEQIICVVPQGASSGAVVVSTDGWTSNESPIFHVARPPVVLGVVPASGGPGSLVTVQGENFGTKKGQVTIGGLAAKISKKGWKYDSIACKLPASLQPGSQEVTVTTQYGSHTLPGAFVVPGP